VPGLRIRGALPTRHHTSRRGYQAQGPLPLLGQLASKSPSYLVLVRKTGSHVISLLVRKSKAHEGVTKHFRTESITKYTLTFGITR
jgi:hypothetical protein